MLILVLLAASGSVVYAAVSTGFINNIVNPPDFTITSSPASQGVTQGITAAQITVTSVNGYVGIIDLSVTVSPGGANSPAVSINPAAVTIQARGVATADLNISTVNVGISTKLLPFNITVVGLSGGRSHSTLLSVTVLGPQRCYVGFICPSFSDPLLIYVNQDPTTLQVSSIQVNNHAPYPISLYSYFYTDSFKAQLGTEHNLNSLLGPNAYTSFFATQPGGRVKGLVMLWQAPIPPPTYTSQNQLNQSWTSTSGPPPEALSFESYTINTGTNTTVWIRNTGTISVTLTSYSVRDSSGDQYSITSWNGATLNPTILVGVNLLVGSSCPSCVLTGNPFTFTATDTATVVTSRASQFTFTV